MNRDIILAIDCGTQSVRALLFDLQSNLLLKARVPIQPYFSLEPGWAEQDADLYWKWQAVPVEPDRLPELAPPAGQIGQITPAASVACGIPKGLPLVAAAADKACEVIGAGCLEPRLGCLSYGATATLNTTHRRYLEVIPLIPPFPAAVPGAYSVEVSVYRGFWMVSWFKEEFSQIEQQIAREPGR